MCFDLEHGGGITYKYNIIGYFLGGWYSLSKDVYFELLSIARSIQDPYLRALTYARIGYYMYLAKRPKYKDAFSSALRAIASIENPPLMVHALIEVGTLLSSINLRVLTVFSKAPMRQYSKCRKHQGMISSIA